jgi:UDP-glucuronate 4-epimerase
MKALITGGAGFIGSHLADRLLADRWHVTVVDNFDPFYARAVKEANIAAHRRSPGYELVEADIRDRAALGSRLSGDYDVIVHLAARAGVRPSIADPIGYQAVNAMGTQNLLELARERGIKQFVFASSSSVYGVNPDVPWRETASLLPISPYASTKLSGEMMGHVYSHLYGIRFIALRFFTVFGPRQRPDLAIHKLSRCILNGEPVPVYGDGGSRRDYTYIADIIQGVKAAMDYSASNYEVINLGGSHPIGLLEMIETIERHAGVRARLSFQPDQPGDVPQTFAYTGKAHSLLGYEPHTDFDTGVRMFMEWLRSAVLQEAVYA